MKTLILNDRELNYEIRVSGGEYCDYYYTRFYEGTTTTHRKKYYLFGDVIPVVRPKFIFDLWFDIESINVTKEECQEKITKALEKYDKKQKRLKEIKNGEIV